MSVHTKLTFGRAIEIIARSFTKSNNAITPLGRWKLDANKNINLIVDYSNEDHCGSCAQYIHHKHREQMNLQGMVEQEAILAQEYEVLLTNTQD